MTTTMPVGEFSLPDPPRGQSDEGNWVTHLSINGNVHFLVHHFGHEDTTIYGGRLYIVQRPGPPSDPWQVPDLLIAFDVDSSLYYRSNGYIISEQGKSIEAAYKQYTLEVNGSSMTPATKRTYLLHAHNFVRWLYFDFQPGCDKASRQEFSSGTKSGRWR